MVNHHGPLPPVKYGDERVMLDATLPIVEALYCWVNGTRVLDRELIELMSQVFMLPIFHRRTSC